MSAVSDGKKKKKKEKNDSSSHGERWLRTTRWASWRRRVVSGGFTRFVMSWKIPRRRMQLEPKQRKSGRRPPRKGVPLVSGRGALKIAHPPLRGVFRKKNNGIFGRVNARMRAWRRSSPLQPFSNLGVVLLRAATSTLLLLLLRSTCARGVGREGREPEQLSTSLESRAPPSLRNKNGGGVSPSLPQNFPTKKGKMRERCPPLPERQTSSKATSSPHDLPPPGG